MFSIPALTMNSNKNYKINFDGGQLSSDGGLLLIKEFFHKIGFEKLINRSFMISDSDSRRKHTDSENLLQMIYQTMGAYFRDDRADKTNWLHNRRCPGLSIDWIRVPYCR